MPEAYQMPQKTGRQGKGNTFAKGITPAENYGTNPMQNTGVPLQGFKGVPVDQGRGQFGVPIPGQGKVARQEPQTPHCTAITKKGDPCKAAPIRGEFLCVGHKSAEKRDS